MLDKKELIKEQRELILENFRLEVAELLRDFLCGRCEEKIKKMSIKELKKLVRIVLHNLSELKKTRGLGFGQLHQIGEMYKTEWAYMVHELVEPFKCQCCYDEYELELSMVDRIKLEMDKLDLKDIFTNKLSGKGLMEKIIHAID